MADEASKGSSTSKKVAPASDKTQKATRIWRTLLNKQSKPINSPSSSVYSGTDTSQRSGSRSSILRRTKDRSHMANGSKSNDSSEFATMHEFEEWEHPETIKTEIPCFDIPGRISATSVEHKPKNVGSVSDKKATAYVIDETTVSGVGHEVVRQAASIPTCVGVYNSASKNQRRSESSSMQPPTTSNSKNIESPYRRVSNVSGDNSVSSSGKESGDDHADMLAFFTNEEEEDEDDSEKIDEDNILNVGFHQSFDTTSTLTFNASMNQSASLNSSTSRIGEIIPEQQSASGLFLPNHTPSGRDLEKDEEKLLELALAESLREQNIRQSNYQSSSRYYSTKLDQNEDRDKNNRIGMQAGVTSIPSSINNSYFATRVQNSVDSVDICATDDISEEEMISEALRRSLEDFGPLK